MREEDLIGKFVIAYDTIVDGKQCSMEGDEGTPERKPILYNSFNDAFKELFSDALAMLQGRDDDELEEFNEDVTPEMIKEMEEVYDSGDVERMKKFLEDNPQCNDLDEWPEPAETFIMNRKTFIGERGGYITGKKLTEIFNF